MSSVAIPESRVWFITGSAVGIGRALLERVLQSGERAVATARQTEPFLSLSETYPSTQLLVLPLDVTNHAQVTAVFEATRSHFGRLDVVVNNAGYGLHGEVEATPEEEARKQMEVLFWAPVNISKQAVKFMREVNPKGHGGRILNISSTGGYTSNPTLAFYSSGKFALEAFTEALTKEMHPDWNIKAVIIQPGAFRTAIFSKLVEMPVPPAYDMPDSPGVQFRKMLAESGSMAVGDPQKAAKVLMEVAGLTSAPLRIQLGTDSVHIIRSKAAQTIEDGKEFEELANSTNLDGVDKDEIAKMINLVVVSIPNP